MHPRSRLDDMRDLGEERDGPQTLQRSLGAPQLIFLGIGAIIGAGIFVATGTVAAHHAGPAVALSFILAASACLCAGLCYAEFATMVPVSGSAYSYIYATFGRGTAWLIGWCLILEYLMAASTVAVGWSAYLKGLLHHLAVEIPQRYALPTWVSVDGKLIESGALLNLPAVLLLALLTALLLRGVRESVRLNATLVLIKLTIIALFIVFGAFHVDPSNWRPFMPPNSGTFGEFGWSGVLRGAGVIFYSYLGFDTVSTAARETVDPQRNMPRGIIGALLLCTVLYIAFALVLTGLAPYSALGVPNPASAALDHAGPQLHWLQLAVETGAVTGLTSVVLALLYGQSRILYAMARDGVMPPVFGQVRNGSATPHAAVLTCGALALLAASVLPAEVLGELISIGTLTAFVFVCGGILVLRVTRPDLKRPFRTPCAPLVCTAGMLICGYLLMSLPAATWWRFLAWLALGVIFYGVYGRRRKPPR